MNADDARPLQAELKNAARQIANLADIYSALRYAEAEALNATRQSAPAEFIDAAGKARSFEEIGISDAEAFAAVRVFAASKLKARAETVRALMTTQYGVNVAQMASLDREIERAVKAMFHVKQSGDQDADGVVGADAGGAG